MQDMQDKFLRRLDNAAEKQFVYIHSPAGYGKSTAVSLWLKKGGHKAIWRELDTYDNNLALFYLSFCRLLIPNVIIERNQPVEHTIEIISTMDININNKRCFLILDDFHAITNPEIISTLPYVLKRLPFEISVFFLSRTAMPDSWVKRNFCELEYIEKGDYLTAHNFALKNNNYEIAAETTEYVFNNKNFCIDEYVKQTNCCEIPDDICDNFPFLYIHKAFYYYAVGDSVRFFGYADKLRSNIDVINKTFPQLIKYANTCLSLDLRGQEPSFNTYFPVRESLSPEHKKIADCDFQAAVKWLETNLASGGALYKIDHDLTTARAYIITGDFNNALNILNVIRETASAFGRLLDTAEADVLIAITEWYSGRKKAAAERLWRQLNILEPYNHTKVAVNEGASILPILSAILRRGTNRFIKSVYLAAYERSKTSKGLTASVNPKIITLSKQQEYILELLSKGYRNAEIVKMSGISINTVRYHTKIVYRKLNVNCAEDAILKAKEYNMLDSVKHEY
jgi:ATP/maltotriose-dependent transcriptional regulator MalT